MATDASKLNQIMVTVSKGLVNLRCEQKIKHLNFK